MFLFLVLKVEAKERPEIIDVAVSQEKTDILVKNFIVFDALLYKNKIDLSKYGFKKIRMVYDSEIWNSNDNKNLPNYNKLFTVSKKIENKSVVCLDIEHWKTQGSNAEVENSINKYINVLKYVKFHTNNIKLGYYSVIPIRDYYRSINAKGPDAYNDWLIENERLREIAKYVDAVFPELYTFSKSQSNWEKYAMQNINEARKYGKPVYVFLWPMFHDKVLLLKHRYISPEFWRAQLNFCYKHADGIVIWGGWQQEWDNDAPWWLETKKFLKDISAY